MTALLCAMAAIAACAAIHIAAIAGVAAALGVKVREVSLGFGPVLARLGIITIKPVPMGGFVRFKDSREEDIEPWDMHDALDAQPLARRLAIGAAGCAALLLVAVAFAQLDGLQAFASGFGQFFVGALSPLGQAQRLLGGVSDAAHALPFLTLLGLTAAKFAAFNLLPFPAGNGGFMVAAVFRNTVLGRLWPAGLTTCLTLVQIALSLSWVFAVVVYLSGSAGTLDRLIAK